MAKTDIEDPNVVLPPHIKQQIEAGKAAFERMQASSNAPDPPTEPGATSAAPPAVVVSPDKPTEEPPPSSTEKPKEHTPPAVEIRTDDGNVSTAVPEDKTAQELALLRQQHSTLQGKYRADQTKSQARIDELVKETQKLTQQVSDLTMRVLTQTPPTTTQTKPLTAAKKLASITDKEREDYGAELIDLVAKAAQEIADQTVAERLAELQPQVQALSGKMESREEAEKRERDARIYRWMDGNIQGWRQQDDDPLFAAWLDLDDPFSGVKRMQILSNAWHAEDYQRVGLIFKGYVAEQVATTAPTPASTPARGGNGQIRMETLAAPNGGRGRTDAITPSDAPEVPPTPAEIKRYYDRKVRNPKSLSEAEIAQMEGRIARALAAGTIIAQPRV